MEVSIEPLDLESLDVVPSEPDEDPEVFDLDALVGDEEDQALASLDDRDLWGEAVDVLRRRGWSFGGRPVPGESIVMESDDGRRAVVTFGDDGLPARMLVDELLPDYRELLEATRQFDAKLHPRWPKGTPPGPDGKPRAGRFMKVGQRFSWGGKEWEIGFVMNGHVFAHEASGISTQSELREFPTKQVKAKDADVPTTQDDKAPKGEAEPPTAQVTVLAEKTEAAPVHDLSEHGAQKVSGLKVSQVTTVDPYVDSSTHDPSIPIPDGSKITEEEWQRFGKVDQLNYVDLMRRFGPWSGSSAGKSHAEALWQEAKKDFPVKAAKDVMISGTNSQYSHTSGSSTSMLGAFGTSGSLGERMALFEQAREFQREAGAIVQWYLYNELRSPDMFVSHGGHRSAHEVITKHVQEGVPFISGQSFGRNYSAASSWGHTQTMLPLAIRYVAFATNALALTGTAQSFSGEQEVNVSEQMHFVEDRTLILDTSQASQGLKAWLHDQSKKWNGWAPGNIVDMAIAHLNGSEPLPLPPEPAGLSYASEGSGPKWEMPPIMSGQIAHQLERESDEAKEISTIPLLPGDFVEGMKGTRYLILEDPSAWNGVAYMKVDPDSGELLQNKCYHFDSSGVTFYKLKGHVDLPPLSTAVEWEPWNPPDWAPAGEDQLGKVQVGTIVNVEGTYFEVTDQAGTKTMLLDQVTGKKASANAGFKAGLMKPTSPAAKKGHATGLKAAPPVTPTAAAPTPQPVAKPAATPSETSSSLPQVGDTVLITQAYSKTAKPNNVAYGVVKDVHPSTSTWQPGTVVVVELPEGGTYGDWATTKTFTFPPQPGQEGYVEGKSYPEVRWTKLVPHAAGQVPKQSIKKGDLFWRDGHRYTVVDVAGSPDGPIITAKFSKLTKQFAMDAGTHTTLPPIPDFVMRPGDVKIEVDPEPLGGMMPGQLFTPAGTKVRPFRIDTWDYTWVYWTNLETGEKGKSKKTTKRYAITSKTPMVMSKPAPDTGPQIAQVDIAKPEEWLPKHKGQAIHAWLDSDGNGAKQVLITATMDRPEGGKQGDPPFLIQAAVWQGAEPAAYDYGMMKLSELGAHATAGSLTPAFTSGIDLPASTNDATAIVYQGHPAWLKEIPALEGEPQYAVVKADLDKPKPHEETLTDTDLASAIATGDILPAPGSPQDPLPAIESLVPDGITTLAGVEQGDLVLWRGKVAEVATVVDNATLLRLEGGAAFAATGEKRVEAVQRLAAGQPKVASVKLSDYTKGGKVHGDEIHVGDVVLSSKGKLYRLKGKNAKTGTLNFTNLETGGKYSGVNVDTVFTTMLPKATGEQPTAELPGEVISVADANAGDTVHWNGAWWTVAKPAVGNSQDALLVPQMWSHDVGQPLDAMQSEIGPAWVSPQTTVGRSQLPQLKLVDETAEAAVDVANWEADAVDIGWTKDLASPESEGYTIEVKELRDHGEIVAPLTSLMPGATFLRKDGEPMIVKAHMAQKTIVSDGEHNYRVDGDLSVHVAGEGQLTDHAPAVTLGPEGFVSDMATASLTDYTFTYPLSALPLKRDWIKVDGRLYFTQGKDGSGNVWAIDAGEHGEGDQSLVKLSGALIPTQVTSTIQATLDGDGILPSQPTWVDPMTVAPGAHIQLGPVKLLVLERVDDEGDFPALLVADPDGESTPYLLHQTSLPLLVRAHSPEVLTAWSTGWYEGTADSGPGELIGAHGDWVKLHTQDGIDTWLYGSLVGNHMSPPAGAMVTASTAAHENLWVDVDGKIGVALQALPDNALLIGTHDGDVLAVHAGAYTVAAGDATVPELPGPSGHEGKSVTPLEAKPGGFVKLKTGPEPSDLKWTSIDALEPEPGPMALEAWLDVVPGEVSTYQNDSQLAAVGANVFLPDHAAEKVKASDAPHGTLFIDGKGRVVYRYPKEGEQVDAPWDSVSAWGYWYEMGVKEPVKVNGNTKLTPVEAVRVTTPDGRTLPYTLPEGYHPTQVQGSGLTEIDLNVASSDLRIGQLVTPTSSSWAGKPLQVIGKGDVVTFRRLSDGLIIVDSGVLSEHMFHVLNPPPVHPVLDPVGSMGNPMHVSDFEVGDYISATDPLLVEKANVGAVYRIVSKGDSEAMVQRVHDPAGNALGAPMSVSLDAPVTHVGRKVPKGGVPFEGKAESHDIPPGLFLPGDKLSMIDGTSHTVSASVVTPQQKVVPEIDGENTTLALAQPYPTITVTPPSADQLVPAGEVFPSELGPGTWFRIDDDESGLFRTGFMPTNGDEITVLRFDLTDGEITPATLSASETITMIAKPDPGEDAGWPVGWKPYNTADALGAEPWGALWWRDADQETIADLAPGLLGETYGGARWAFISRSEDGAWINVVDEDGSPSQLPATTELTKVATHTAPQAGKHLQWFENDGLTVADLPVGTSFELPPQDVAAGPGSAQQFRIVSSDPHGGFVRAVSLNDSYVSTKLLGKDIVPAYVSPTGPTLPKIAGLWAESEGTHLSELPVGAFALVQKPDGENAHYMVLDHLTFGRTRVAEYDITADPNDIGAAHVQVVPSDMEILSTGTILDPKTANWQQTTSLYQALQSGALHAENAGRGALIADLAFGAWRVLHHDDASVVVEYVGQTDDSPMKFAPGTVREMNLMDPIQSAATSGPPMPLLKGLPYADPKTALDIGWGPNLPLPAVGDPVWAITSGGWKQGKVESVDGELFMVGDGDGEKGWSEALPLSKLAPGAGYVPQAGWTPDMGVPQIGQVVTVTDGSNAIVGNVRAVDSTGAKVRYLIEPFDTREQPRWATLDALTDRAGMTARHLRSGTLFRKDNGELWIITSHSDQGVPQAKRLGDTTTTWGEYLTPEQLGEQITPIAHMRVAFKAHTLRKHDRIVMNQEQAAKLQSGEIPWSSLAVVTGHSDGFVHVDVGGTTIDLPDNADVPWDVLAGDVPTPQSPPGSKMYASKPPFDSGWVTGVQGPPGDVSQLAVGQMIFRYPGVQSSQALITARRDNGVEVLNLDSGLISFVPDDETVSQAVGVFPQADHLTLGEETQVGDLYEQQGQLFHAFGGPYRVPDEVTLAQYWQPGDYVRDVIEGKGYQVTGHDGKWVRVVDSSGEANGILPSGLGVVKYPSIYDAENATSGKPVADIYGSGIDGGDEGGAMPVLNAQGIGGWSVVQPNTKAQPLTPLTDAVNTDPGEAAKARDLHVGDTVRVQLGKTWHRTPGSIGVAEGVVGPLNPDDPAGAIRVFLSPQPGFPQVSLPVYPDELLSPGQPLPDPEPFIEPDGGLLQPGTVVTTKNGIAMVLSTARHDGNPTQAFALSLVTGNVLTVTTAQDKSMVGLPVDLGEQPNLKLGGEKWWLSPWSPVKPTGGALASDVEPGDLILIRDPVQLSKATDAEHASADEMRLVLVQGAKQKPDGSIALVWTDAVQPGSPAHDYHGNTNGPYQESVIPATEVVVKMDVDAPTALPAGFAATTDKPVGNLGNGDVILRDDGTVEVVTTGSTDMPTGDTATVLLRVGQPLDDATNPELLPPQEVSSTDLMVGDVFKQSPDDPTDWIVTATNGPTHVEAQALGFDPDVSAAPSTVGLPKTGPKSMVLRERGAFTATSFADLKVGDVYGHRQSDGSMKWWEVTATNAATVLVKPSERAGLPGGVGDKAGASHATTERFYTLPVVLRGLDKSKEPVPAKWNELKVGDEFFELGLKWVKTKESDANDQGGMAKVIEKIDSTHDYLLVGNDYSFSMGDDTITVIPGGGSPPPKPSAELYPPGTMLKGVNTPDTTYTVTEVNTGGVKQFTVKAVTSGGGSYGPYSPEEMDKLFTIVATPTPESAPDVDPDYTGASLDPKYANVTGGDPIDDWNDIPIGGIFVSSGGVWQKTDNEPSQGGKGDASDTVGHAALVRVGDGYGDMGGWDANQLGEVWGWSPWEHWFEAVGVADGPPLPAPAELPKLSKGDRVWVQSAKAMLTVADVDSMGNVELDDGSIVSKANADSFLEYGLSQPDGGWKPVKPEEFDIHGFALITNPGALGAGRIGKVSKLSGPTGFPPSMVEVDFPESPGHSYDSNYVTPVKYVMTSGGEVATLTSIADDGTATVTFPNNAKATFAVDTLTPYWLAPPSPQTEAASDPVANASVPPQKAWAQFGDVPVGGEFLAYGTLWKKVTGNEAIVTVPTGNWSHHTPEDRVGYGVDEAIDMAKYEVTVDPLSDAFLTKAAITQTSTAMQKQLEHASSPPLELPGGVTIENFGTYEKPEYRVQQPVVNGNGGAIAEGKEPYAIAEVAHDYVQEAVELLAQVAPEPEADAALPVLPATDVVGITNVIQAAIDNDELHGGKLVKIPGWDAWIQRPIPSESGQPQTKKIDVLVGKMKKWGGSVGLVDDTHATAQGLATLVQEQGTPPSPDSGVLGYLHGHSGKVKRKRISVMEPGETFRDKRGLLFKVVSASKTSAVVLDVDANKQLIADPNLWVIPEVQIAHDVTTGTTSQLAPPLTPTKALEAFKDWLATDPELTGPETWMDNMDASGPFAHVTYPDDDSPVLNWWGTPSKFPLIGKLPSISKAGNKRLDKFEIGESLQDADGFVWEVVDRAAYPNYTHVLLRLRGNAKRTFTPEEVPPFLISPVKPMGYVYATPYGGDS